MIHPHTELRLVSAGIGHGVFATRLIPCGTVTYVKDDLEIELTPRQFERLDAVHRQIVDKYSYIDQRGRRIVSWDHAKYVNHRCDCNTLSTGYGFEIAIRDIEAGEEITDDYGLFNLQAPMAVDCGCRKCRKLLLPDDPVQLVPVWDRWVIAALVRLEQVEQPLWHLVDRRTRKAVQEYLSGKGPYRSVSCLQWQPATAALLGDAAACLA
ncbi:MAG: SET domain-containing protein [Pseudomonadota bacterium]